MTLTSHSSKDFADQVSALKKRLKRLLRKKKDAWSKVRGLIWWIEPARGASGDWRSHIHAIVAFDELDPPTSPRCLILQWANEHRGERPEPWSEGRWESDRKYIDIIEHQSIEPLYCYPVSELSSRVVSTCNPVARLADVMEVAEYSRTNRRIGTFRPGSRHVPLSANDRVLVTLLGLHLRGCTGVFYGLPVAARKTLEKRLKEIDRSPSLRRQLHTDAHHHPSRAASLIPHPEVELEKKNAPRRAQSKARACP